MHTYIYMHIDGLYCHDNVHINKVRRQYLHKYETSIQRYVVTIHTCTYTYIYIYLKEGCPHIVFIVYMLAGDILLWKFQS